MATQIVILNGDQINVDDSFLIEWKDKGSSMPAIPNTVHCVLWNNLIGQNEIQNKDPSTGMMTGNTNLSSTSDAVGSTTIGDLLTWAETRKTEIKAAKTKFDTAKANDDDAGTVTKGQTWRDYE